MRALAAQLDVEVVKRAVRAFALPGLFAQHLTGAAAERGDFYRNNVQICRMPDADDCLPLWTLHEQWAGHGDSEGEQKDD